MDDSCSSSENEEPSFNVDGKDTKVWMVKVPTFVAQWWSQQAPESSLGCVRIHEPETGPIRRPGDPPAIPKVTMHLPAHVSLPKDYQVDFTNMRPINSFIFSEDSKGRACAITGNVEHEMVVKPPLDDSYIDIMHQRAKDSLPTTNISYLNSNAATAAGKGRVGKAVNDDLFQPFRVAKGEKNIRLPRADVVDLIFDAFIGEETRTLKALVARTKQPVTWLKEVLEDVCFQHKRGHLIGAFELKPEYKSKSGKIIASAPTDSKIMKKPRN